MLFVRERHYHQRPHHDACGSLVWRFSHNLKSISEASLQWLALAFWCILALQTAAFAQRVSQPVITTHSVPVLTVEGLKFRDLNRDGKLEPFEDWRLSPEQRTDDLLSRLSIAEKAGLMMHGVLPALGDPSNGFGQTYDLAAANELIATKNVTTFLTRLSSNATPLAAQSNLVQDLAERTRYAIPLTISSDPRNSFTSARGASTDAEDFSKWPDMTGLAALNEPATTTRFGDIARQEYLAVGIQEALSPQADLATEPRWPRISGTFGEDPQTAKTMVRSYIAGFQNGENGLHPGSVMCVVKHWVGYGAMKEGLDSHNSYSRIAMFPGHALEQHLIPFEGAFQADVAGVMPTYAIIEGVSLDGKSLEPVGASFDKQLITDLLRKRFNFKGIVLTDFRVTADCIGDCLYGAPAGRSPRASEIAMPWGVEKLTVPERFAKAIDAGVDQFGGVSDTDVLVKLVHQRVISEDRIELSARRILEQKFALGLFENPYVDASSASSIVGKSEFRAAAVDAQERSMVLLKNAHKILPIQAAARKVYLVGVNADDATRAGLTPVSKPEKADFALIRMDAPYQKLHPGYFFGSFQHEGDLDYKPDDPRLIQFKALARQVPTVVALYLDRPAILSSIIPGASAVLVNFGASDAALLSVLTGRASPEGRLPFELPRSMEAVRAQLPDVPHDSASPLFPISFGLRY